MNKKGNMDNMMIPFMLFAIAVTIFVGYKILDAGGDAFAGYGASTALIDNGQTMLNRIGNNGFFFIAFALILFNMFGAFLLITHPIFVVIDLFLMPFSVIIAVVMSNAWESSLHLWPEASIYIVADYLMMHLPIVIIVADILCAIAAYAFVKQ